jgi:hypothetical protein
MSTAQRADVSAIHGCPPEKACCHDLAYRGESLQRLPRPRLRQDDTIARSQPLERHFPTVVELAKAAADGGDHVIAAPGKLDCPNPPLPDSKSTTWEFFTDD